MNLDEMFKMRAGKPIDDLVAELVMGWKKNGNIWEITTSVKGKSSSNLHNFSTSMDAAWMIAEMLADKGYAPNLVYDDNGHFALSFSGTNSIYPVCDVVTSFIEDQRLWCTSAPLAICKGALYQELKFKDGEK
jgi:hypothetical protein